MTTFTITNSSTFATKRLEAVIEALAHWSPYRRITLEVVPTSACYSATCWPTIRRIRIRLGHPDGFPVVDDCVPTIPWGRVMSRTQAVVGLLAHELWHLRQHRAGTELIERPADRAAVHALTHWRAGRRRCIPIPERS